MSERVAALERTVMELSERLRTVERLLASHRHSVAMDSGITYPRPVWEGWDYDDAIEMMDNIKLEGRGVFKKYADLVRNVERNGGVEVFKEHFARAFEAACRAAEQEKDPEDRVKAKKLACDLYSSFVRVDLGLMILCDEWEVVSLEFVGAEDVDDPAGR